MSRTTYSRLTREELISVMQRRLRPIPVTATTPAHYARKARWWELEALRGCGSSERSRQYAACQRWLAELALEHGPGNPAELLRRSGSKMPEFSENRPTPSK